MKQENPITNQYENIHIFGCFYFILFFFQFAFEFMVIFFQAHIIEHKTFVFNAY